LGAVWETYGSFGEKTLESMIIQEEPWIQAWKSKEKYNYTPTIISIDSMREFYSKQSKKNDTV
jgi:uncharacterized phage-associated protein